MGSPVSHASLSPTATHRGRLETRSRGHCICVGRLLRQFSLSGSVSVHCYTLSGGRRGGGGQRLCMASSLAFSLPPGSGRRRGGESGARPPVLSISPSTIVLLAGRPAIGTAGACGCCVGTGRGLVRTVCMYCMYEFLLHSRTS